MDDETRMSAAIGETEPRRGLIGWAREIVRAALLLRPDWAGLRATPATLAVVVGGGLLVSLGIDRLEVDGPATLWWPAFLAGWLGVSALAWACWLVRRGDGSGPDAATLFALATLLGIVLDAGWRLVALGIADAGWTPDVEAPHAGWLAWLVPAAWVVVAQVRLLWRCAVPARVARALAAAAVVGPMVVGAWLYPVHFWYDAEPAAEAGPPPLALTQQLLEGQPALLAEQLAALKPQRPGTIDLYAITFAPYASQDVFMRESALVAGVMADRFDARGRTLQLVNNPASAQALPWATPLNLQRAIRAAAARMDRDEDVLFLHLTSHGGADGVLAAEFDPLAIDPVTPQALKAWLDEAGVRWRVISVSACFAGSWVAPLAGDGTLVMTAADADHTSYGCGSRSPLTFFGQAMYDEQLRRTWSFERAHAAAREVIARREQAAGKKDGYSNPQISLGAAIRPRLVRLEAQLAARAAGH